MSQLSYDILANILSRLPAKFLLQCKCVCKKWKSLISDPQFAKLQVNQISQKDSNINPHRLLFSTKPLQSMDYEAFNGSEDGGNAISELHYPAEIEKDFKYDVELAGSCNGLVCLVIDKKEFILWNPCTRESRPLPKPPVRIGLFNYDNYGLGYDFSINDYKLIIWSGLRMGEVLSMKSNVWKRIANCETNMALLGSCGVFLNGWLYWLGMMVPSVDFKIISFDLAEEKLQVVPLPDCVKEDKKAAPLGALVVSGDCLCIFVEYGRNVYEGWQRKECDWIKFFSYRFDHRTYLYHYRIRPAPLCYTETGKVIICYGGSELKMYDPNKERFKNVPIRKNGWIRWITYCESLVSPHFM